MKRVDEQLFNQVKSGLRNKWTSAEKVARRNELSVKTVLQIRGSKDFAQYTENNKAQHPDIKFSLRDHVLELHRLAFRQDNTYIPPTTAKTAVIELINTLKGVNNGK